MPLERIIEIMERLMGPKGCPWDRKQTRDSLKRYLVEELYELLEALDTGEPERIKEELGDMLFQIVFHSHLSKEMGQFDINDVIDTIADKMIKRHPHVFGDKRFKSLEDFMSFWDEHKKQERCKRETGFPTSPPVGQAGHGPEESVLDGIPDALPALLKSYKLQEKASSVGFDWEKVEDVFDKLDEELNELRSAIKRHDPAEIEDEIGDVLFVMVRVSGFMGVNPEDALRRSIRKFIRRFRYIETEADKQGRKLSDMTLREMEVLWNEAKNAFDFDNKEKGA